jgi:hypothetical protein
MELGFQLKTLSYENKVLEMRISLQCSQVDKRSESAATIAVVVSKYLIFFRCSVGFAAGSLNKLHV